MHESEVESYGDLLAVKYGYEKRKLVYQGRVAAPDKMYFGNGRVMFVEYKKPKGERRVTQELEIRRMKKAGLEAYFVETKEECRAVFERL